MLSNPVARRTHQTNLSRRPSPSHPTVALIWRERKSPFPHCLNTYFSNSFLQKSFNGFFAGPWWKQWLLTFLSLPPFLHPSPPTLQHSRLISLSKWFLTPSISRQPFRPRPGLEAAATHCDRWNESPEKSHLLINAWRHSASQIIFFPLLLSLQQMGERKKRAVI